MEICCTWGALYAAWLARTPSFLLRPTKLLDLSRGYKYLVLAVCEATNFTFVKFMKKKSEALLTFMDLVTFLGRQHDIKVCILHTDFGEVNSATAKTNFARKGIKWEASSPYAQQQNRLAKQHMRTTVEGAQTIMVYSGLPLHLWTEAISTVVYIARTSYLLRLFWMEKLRLKKPSHSNAHHALIIFKISVL